MRHQHNKLLLPSISTITDTLGIDLRTSRS